MPKHTSLPHDFDVARLNRRCNINTRVPGARTLHFSHRCEITQLQKPMAATTKAKAMVVAAGAAAVAYYLRRKRRAARMKLLATHTKIALLASERGAVVAMSPATSTVTRCGVPFEL